MGKVPPYSYSKLKSSQVKDLISQLELGYGCDLKELNSYQFSINNQNKVFIFKADIENVDISKVNLMGVYFGTFTDEGTFRLSIEGTHFINPKKNYAILKEENLKDYLSVQEMKDNMFEEVNRDDSYPFVIVQFEENNLGVISGKQEPYHNYVSKARKLEKEKVF